MINCYNTYDREFTFTDRIFPQGDLEHYQANKSYFATMSNEGSSLELKQDSVIKWKTEGNDGFVIIGKIKDFIVHQQIPALDVCFLFFSLRCEFPND